MAEPDKQPDKPKISQEEIDRLVKEGHERQAMDRINGTSSLMSGKQTFTHGGPSGLGTRRVSEPTDLRDTPNPESPDTMPIDILDGQSVPRESPALPTDKPTG